MKKTYNNFKKYVIFFSFVVCLFVFNNACGLDVYKVVESPTQMNHIPYYSNEFDERYFEFFTNENTKNSAIEGTFKGTMIFYRIYNSNSMMSSETSNINSLIYSEDNKANAIDRLLTTYNYQLLRIKDSTDQIIIQTNGSDLGQKIKIRLSDYQYYSTDEERDEKWPYRAGFYINDKHMGIPVRTNNYTFNFGREGIEENSRVPLEEDEDVKFSENVDEEDENKWYVALYAVGVALEVDYSLNYSVPKDLGVVTIDDTLEDN